VLPHCASLADSTDIRAIATIRDYDDRTGGILEGEHPLSPLRIILFFIEFWQTISDHEFLGKP
jgi:hypothetical protein